MDYEWVYFGSYTHTSSSIADSSSGCSRHINAATSADGASGNR